MPDKDLRRAALDKTKTVSRKAAARSSLSSPGHLTPTGSAKGSRAASRIASRNVSDDEDEFSGNLSDDTNQSINSIDAFLESEEFSETNLDTLKSSLATTIDEIVERKGSTVTGREDALDRYVRILISHHFGDVLYGRVEEILVALMKSVKSEASPRETQLALRAISLTAVSFESATLYDTVSGLIKRTISDSQDNSTKAAAIHALGMCLTFGGAGDDEIAEVCTFLLEVVSSDGSFVGADDNAEVVAASIQTYSFLATQLEDLEGESEDAVEALLEQLNAGSAQVQIAAGEAIALLFEKSYTPREDDDDSENEEEGEDSGDSDGPSTANIDKTLVKRYNAYHNASEVLERVSALASLSSKGLNRTDKKKLHQAFASVVITVEDPRAGLQTNNSSRMIVRIHREGEIKVDKWWKLMRLNALRRLLAGGFINHYYEGNKQVLNVIPVLVRSTGSGMMSPRRTPRRAGDKYRDARRFVSHGADGD